MSKQSILLLSIFLFSLQQKTNRTCSLSMQPPLDPHPSLLQCYIYNTLSCCLSVHDEIISSQVTEFLSETCSKKYYPFLNLLCYGCHPNEFDYTDHDKKTIKLCDSFVQSIWGSNLSEPSTMYNNCGFKTSKFSTLSNMTSSQYIIPSLVFDNVTTFLNSFTLPFFDGYSIEIVNTNNENYPPCFAGFSVIVKLPVFFLVLYILMIN